jgi:hypothetical protein
MQTKIIAVANPDTIPGGLETVRKVVAELLADEPFEIVACKKRASGPRRSVPRYGYGKRRAARLAKHAFKKIADAHVGIGFSRRNERLNPTRLGGEYVRKVTYFEACGKAGLAGHGSVMHKESFTPEIAEKMLFTLLGRSMLTGSKSKLALS